MNKLILSAFVIFALFASIALSNEEEKKATAVIQITTDNQEIIKSGNWLVEFYAPWCGHCKRLAPVYEELGQHYNVDTESSTVKIAQVNCDDYKGVCGKYDVKGYPTIKYLVDGEPRDYKGGRDKKSFIKYLDELSKSPILNIESTEQLKEKLKEDKVSFVFVSTGSESKDNEAFEQVKKVAKQIQDIECPNFLFVADSAMVKDIEGMTDFNVVNSPVLTVYKDKEFKLYTGGGNQGTINQWIRINQFPIVLELTYSNQHMLTASFNKIVMFVLPKKPTTQQIDYMKSIASSKVYTENPAEYGFTYIVESSFASWIANFKLEKTPAILVFPEKMDIYYYEESVDPLNKQSVDQFLSDIHENKLSLKYLNRLGHYIEKMEEFTMEYIYYFIGLIVVLTPLVIYFTCIREVEDQTNKEKDS